MSTFGPAYNKRRDVARLHHQQERIRDYLLLAQDWRTLAEIRAALEYPEASISAQLRHLRKVQFGSYRVEKRRRQTGNGTWEYRVLLPDEPATLSMFEEPATGATA